ncbi:hypothetical protein LXL04_035968 [Taraxacum kok-saghyz]
MSKTMMKVLCVAVAFMVVSAPYTMAITCDDVVKKLTPCANYLKKGGAVSASCCKGVKGLHAAAKTTPDRKTACVCMKEAYKSNPGIKPGNALVLPKKCSVAIPYKISLKTDCSKVK